MTTSRRDLLALGAAGTILPAAALAAPASGTAQTRAPEPRWRPGVEGQRRADLGDGRYLNPILAGDHPDPSILKDGDDYWMTHSSFDAAPGLLIWHSRAIW
jgi:xylan 1,4-beta-xylosidase